MIFFWQEKWPSDELEKRWDYKLKDKVGSWLASGLVNDLCEWIEEKKKRNIKIRIDRYDTWSMDHTLSLIAVPMLKQLKDTKHGAPGVDDEDVPEELRSTSAPPLTEEQINCADVDDNHFKRWDWVLDEMIWSHEQILDDNADDEFYSKEPDPDNFLTYATKFDKEGYAVWYARKSNGLKLFGKYYQNLWD
jgi:hypothetical protein